MGTKLRNLSPLAMAMHQSKKSNKVDAMEDEEEKRRKRKAVGMKSGGVIKKLRDTARRNSKRLEIMGEEGKRDQDLRSVHLTGTGPERTRQSTREAIKRVGEYKQAKAAKTKQVANKKAGGKVKMAKGGQCRGGGAATRGLKFGRNG